MNCGRRGITQSFHFPENKIDADVKYKKPSFTLLVAYIGICLPFPYRPAHAVDCVPVDAEFERIGKIVHSRIISGDTVMQSQNIGSPEYLDGMLDTLPNNGNGYRYGEILPKSVHIAIKPKGGISIVSKLPDGRISASLNHRMDCVDGFWAISKAILSGTETTAKYNLIVDQLKDGTLRVQRVLETQRRDENKLPAGSHEVMAYFRRIPS